ncbi:MAG: alpha/beta hydrolase [Marinilabiliales bacterium]
MNFIEFKNKRLHFVDKGDGKELLLLHGFMESVRIFERIINKLSNNYRIVAIDLPGHGMTDVFSEVHNMEFMAECASFVLDNLKISSASILGHSMGGYAALAFADLYPHKTNALGLIHSHPFADSEEKKNDRLKQIQLIKSGKKDLIIRSLIPNLYATKNIEKLSKEIEFSMNIALNTPAEGIIAALAGMKNRIDRSHVLENNKLPVIWIYGKHDNLINYKMIDKFVKGKSNIKPVLLENSGHMGFVEEPDNTTEEIKAFLNDIF